MRSAAPLPLQSAGHAFARLAIPPAGFGLKVLMLLCGVSPPAWAHGEGAVLTAWLGAALAAGALGGLLSAFRPALHFAWVLAGALLLLALGAALWAGSLELLLIAASYGAALAVLPFAAAFFAVRLLARRLFRRPAPPRSPRPGPRG